MSQAPPGRARGRAGRGRGMTPQGPPPRPGIQPPPTTMPSMGRGGPSRMPRQPQPPPTMTPIVAPTPPPQFQQQPLTHVTGSTHGAAGRAALRGNARGDPRPGELTKGMSALAIGPRGDSRLPRNPYEAPVPIPACSIEKKNRTEDRVEEVQLLTNYFMLTKRTEQQVNHYRVDFEPNIEDKRFKNWLLRQLGDKLDKFFLFDGNNDLKMLKCLPDELSTFQVNSDRGLINIEMKNTGKLAPDHPELCHLYNSQMRRNLAHLGYVQIGRNYFQPLRKHEIREQNVEIWPGLMTPIGEHERGILMAVQTNNKFLRSDRVIDTINQQMSERGGGNMSKAALYEKLKSALLGQVVMTRYNNRTYTIVDFDLEQTPRSSFTLKNGETTTYIDYYEKHHQIKIRDVNQPLLVALSKEKEAKATRVEKKAVQLIPEICCLTGLSETQRNNFHFMQNVARFTRLGPTQRVQELNEFMNELRRSEKVTAEMEAWNLQFEPSPLRVTGHRLQLEDIYVANDQKFAPKRDTIDFTPICRSRLYLPQNLKNWVTIVSGESQRRNNNKITIFLKDLTFVAQNMGFPMSEPEIINILDDRVGTYHTALQNLNPSVEMVLVLIPTSRVDTYQAIKRQCIQEKGIPSQVVCVKTILNVKNTKSLATKVALQMSCKVGGIPWHLSIPFKTLMVLGYDTYHDASSKGKSLGALVASIDVTITQWFSQGRRHQTTGAQEIANTMESMFTLALKKYHKVNNRFPDTIIYYRDGVGEGQIANVKEDECDKIKEVYLKLCPDKPLKIVFIVVNKRINTRYFQIGRQPENPLPGTVVDTGITRRNRFDFFLVSQSVRQGTVSPTSYYVIEDTTKIPANRIQRLTYKLTHLYFNWTGTISVPAPCQYAHKLAFLMGQALTSERIHARLQDKLFFL